MIESGSPLEALGFCPTLAAYFEEGVATGRSGKVFHSLGSLSTINNLLVLRSLMLDLKPVHTLEVGLCFGASALAIAASHLKLGNQPSGQHIAIDPFQTECWDDSAIVALEKANLRGFVDLKQDFSGIILPRLWEMKHQVQLAYIDGSHLCEDVFVDCYFVSRLLSMGGIMALDDSSDPHVLKVVNFFRRNMTRHFEEVDLNQYRNKPRHPLLYKLAKQLGRLQMTAFRRIGNPAREWDSPFARF